jgi:hypothetical protein
LKIRWVFSGIDWKYQGEKTHLILSNNPAGFEQFFTCGLKINAGP